MKLIEKIFIFFDKAAKNAVGAYAAFAAFFTIVSFFPFLMLLLTLLQFLPFSAAEVIQYSSSLLPQSVTEVVDPIITEIYSAGTGLISATAIASVWAASKGVYAIICGLNQVYGVKETRNLMLVRAMSVFYTIVFILMIVMSVVLLLFGAKLFALLETFVPWISHLAGLRYILGAVVFVLFFLIVFCALPNRRAKITKELPGALVAALGWIGFSAIYSYYINHFSRFPGIYGSIAAVVFLMLWLYFCMYIMLLAAQINAGRYQTDVYDMWKTP